MSLTNIAVVSVPVSDLARWLMPNDFRLIPGHQFTFRTQPRPDDGFDPDDPIQQSTHRIMGAGWRSGVITALQATLGSAR